MEKLLHLLKHRDEFKNIKNNTILGYVNNKNKVFLLRYNKGKYDLLIESPKGKNKFYKNVLIKFENNNVILKYKNKTLKVPKYFFANISKTITPKKFEDRIPKILIPKKVEKKIPINIFYNMKKQYLLTKVNNKFKLYEYDDFYSTEKIKFNNFKEIKNFKIYKTPAGLGIIINNKKLEPIGVGEEIKDRYRIALKKEINKKIIAKR